MGPGKNALSYNKAILRVEPLIEGKLKAKDEAKPFVDFLLKRKMTLEQCRKAILMTEEQFDWLVKHKWASPVTLHELRLRRLKIWDEFVSQLREKFKAAKAAA